MGKKKDCETIFTLGDIKLKEYHDPVFDLYMLNKFFMFIGLAVIAAIIIEILVTALTGLGVL